MSYKTGFKIDFPDQLREFVKSQFVMVLGVVSDARKIHLSTVYYVTDNGEDLYVISKSDGRKVSYLEENSLMSVLITDVKTMETVEMEGTSEVVTDSSEVMEWMKKMVSKVESESVDGWLPVLQTSGVGLVLIKFEPERWFWSRFNEVFPGDGALGEGH